MTERFDDRFYCIVWKPVFFYAYLVSVQLIGATRASLLACVEPLSAAFLQ